MLVFAIFNVFAVTLLLPVLVVLSPPVFPLAEFPPVLPLSTKSLVIFAVLFCAVVLFVFVVLSALFVELLPLFAVARTEVHAITGDGGRQGRRRH